MGHDQLFKDFLRAFLREFLEKFGPVSSEVASRVNALDSISELDGFLDRLVAAESMEEMQLGTVS